MEKNPGHAGSSDLMSFNHGLLCRNAASQRIISRGTMVRLILLARIKDQNNLPYTKKPHNPWRHSVPASWGQLQTYILLSLSFALFPVLTVSTALCFFLCLTNSEVKAYGVLYLLGSELFWLNRSKYFSMIFSSGWMKLNRVILFVCLH